MGNLSVLEQMAVALAMALLKAEIKSPSKVATEKSIVATFATLSTEADSVTNGTVWTSTPAPAAVTA